MIAKKENLYFKLILHLMCFVRFSLVLLFFLNGGLSIQAQDKWEIDKKASIEFSGKKAQGSLSGLTGNIVFSPDSLSSSYFNVEVDVATIETGNSLKNKHAKNENWFFVDQFPKISFRSENIIRRQDRFIAAGVLEVRGVKREAQIIFDFEENEQVGIFLGTMKVNRLDFGIEGNMMAFVVGEDFDVSIEVPVLKVSKK